MLSSGKLKGQQNKQETANANRRSSLSTTVSNQMYHAFTFKKAESALILETEKVVRCNKSVHSKKMHADKTNLSNLHDEISRLIMIDAATKTIQRAWRNKVEQMVCLR